jgi:hypothetical protein
MQQASLACYDLGADYSTVLLPTPPQTAPVPVKSTGACNAIQQMRPVIEALKCVEVIVDVTVEGLIHAEEWPEIEESGTRLLTICNEHPEILERTEPTAYLQAWEDPIAYGISHVGFGVNPGARWESLALYDKRDVQAVEPHAWAGNFLWSTGSNQYANRFTLGHFDLPMRACTVSLDGVDVVVNGRLQGDLA